MKFLYTEKELKKLEAHIENEFGQSQKVIHELISPDIHLDILIIPPTEENDFYILVTLGAGAYKMNLPREIKDRNKFARAEYVIFLPKEWNIESEKQEDRWPIEQLRSIGRLALETDSWLAYRHTVLANSDSSPLAKNTKLNSFALLCAYNRYHKLTKPFKLGLFKTIRFYQLYPLYQEELDFTLENDMDALLDKIGDENINPIVQIDRKNYCSSFS